MKIDPRHGHKYSIYKTIFQYDGASMYQGTPEQHSKFNSWKNKATLRLS